MSACRSIRFIASAGTGKTHQVVSLYQALLFGRPYPATDDAVPGIKAGAIFDGQARIAPERILMLTFTKNAAAEMRARVTEAIEQELAGGNTDTEAFCWTLLRRLSGATIATIHAFAQQLLACHTLHLGLSPTLTILEDADAESLRAEIIETTLKEALVGKDTRHAEALLTLCDGRGVKGVEEAVARALRLGTAWGLDLETADPAALVTPPERPDIEALQGLLKRLENSHWLKSKIRDAVLSALREALDAPGLCGKSDGESRRAAARRRAMPQEGDPQADAHPIPLRLAEIAAAIRPVSKGNWGQSDDIKALKQETETTLDGIAAYPAQLEATGLLTAFLRLARDCARRIQARKRAQGTLDFDDLLTKAHALISERPESIPALDVIIVDEAQDNSRLQNEIIRLIQAHTQASLVLCGDTKQTIYGWRGADAEGLPRFAASMQLDAVPLRTSYRSQKGILDWVNDIFAGVILGTEHYGESETLVPCPKAAEMQGPSVEILLPPWEWGPEPRDAVTVGTGKKAEPKPRIALTPRELRALAEDAPDDASLQALAEQSRQAVALEARAVARRIRLLTDPHAGAGWHPAHVWDSGKGEWIKTPPKPYRYRDILILLRAGTRQELYEQALQEEGIPFTTDGKGRGFFTRQETLDIANLLAWLAFPTDGLAWTGLLRSPFIALSDNAIATLGPRPGTWPAAGGAEDAALRRAKAFLDRMRALAGRISAVEIVREAIRLSGYDAILAGTFHGIQRLANLQKLLSWIQTRERDETLTLQATARRLADEITREREAPDAAVLDPDDDSVRINTVHAAKGLSSPVVMLPDLRRVPQSDRDWILVTHGSGGAPDGLAGKVRQYADDDTQDTPSARFDDAAERNKAMRDQESRRLFYVACTRARDLLILSGENPGNGSKDAWRAWVNQHVIHCDFKPGLFNLRPYGEVEKAWRRIAKPPAQPISPDPARFHLGGPAAVAPAGGARYRYPVTALLHSLGEGRPLGKETPHRDPLPQGERKEKAKQGLPLPQEESTSGTKHLLPLPSGERAGVRVLASKAFRLRLALAPVQVAPVGHEDQEAPDAISDRTLLGTLAHRILETLDYTNPATMEAQVEQAPEWAEADADERAQTLPQVMAAARHLAARLAGVPTEHIIRELPFAARFAHGGAEVIVDGKVDLIYLKDGIWHLVDYKFSDHDATTLAARYAMQLAVYREAVSAPGAAPGLRIPRFRTATRQPAPFRLMLLGIHGNGACEEIIITQEAIGDIPATLIAAARDLANGRDRQV